MCLQHRRRRKIIHHPLTNCDMADITFKISYPFNKIQSAIFECDVIPRPSNEDTPLFETLSYLDQSIRLLSKNETLQMDFHNQRIGYYIHIQGLNQITSFKTGGWHIKEYIDITLYFTAIIIIIVIAFIAYVGFMHQNAIRGHTAASTLPTTHASFIFR